MKNLPEVTTCFPGSDAVRNLHRRRSLIRRRRWLIRRRRWLIRRRRWLIRRRRWLIRRRRWLIGAQGSSIARTLGNFTGNPSNPERVRQLANAFSVAVLFQSQTQGCRYAPTAGLKLANAFGVNPN